MVRMKEHWNMISSKPFTDLTLKQENLEYATEILTKPFYRAAWYFWYKIAKEVRFKS